MNLETKRLQAVQVEHLQSKPTVIKCNPSRADIVALGFENGQIFFLKLSNQQTFIFDAHPDSHKLQCDDYTPPGMRIEDLAWDPHEDNMLVSFGDKRMCLISF